MLMLIEVDVMFDVIVDVSKEAMWCKLMLSDVRWC